MLNIDEQRRLDKMCKENPFKALALADAIFKKLQMKTIRDFAAVSVMSERSVYNAVNDIESSRLVVTTISGEKFISVKLNDHAV